MSTPVEPPLYDVAAALNELDKYRATATDPVTAAMIGIGDKLASHMARHFPDERDRHVAGVALIIAAASLQRLQGLDLNIVCNVAGVAGHQLYQAGGAA